MAGSRKKVVVRMESGAVLAGYLPASGLVDRTRCSIDLLEVGGRIVPLLMEEVRHVAYVRDFNLDDPHTPERLMRRVFLARPRTEGLWLRLTFRDGEVLEGLAPLDGSLLDDAIVDAGVFLIPPDVRSNTQRMYVPRSSMSGLQVLSVVTTPSKGVASTNKEKGEEARLPFPEIGTLDKQ